MPGAGGDDWTKDNLNTQFYDSLKVQAVVNWASGRNHDGSANAAGVLLDELPHGTSARAIQRTETYVLSADAVKEMVK